MLKKVLYLTLLVALINILNTGKTCYSFTLFKRHLTTEQALNSALPRSEKIVEEKKVLTEEQEKIVMERLNVTNLVEWQITENGMEKRKDKEYVFYFGTKNGEKKTVAVLMLEYTLWGPMEFVIGMDIGGKVQSIRLIRYDPYLREMASQPFLKQFKGKTGKDISKLEKSIDIVTGATASCEITIYAVKKAIVLYEELFLKERGREIK